MESDDNIPTESQLSKGVVPPAILKDPHSTDSTDMLPLASGFHLRLGSL